MNEPNGVGPHGAVTLSLKRGMALAPVTTQMSLKKQPVAKGPTFRVSIYTKRREYRAGSPVETKSGFVVAWGPGWEGWRM